MRLLKYSWILSLLVPVLLSGCAGGKTITTRYYLIDPVDYAETFNTPAPLRLEVIDLHIPQYLERFHIAYRASENRLAFSESHQWGENLRKNLLRTLAGNLSGLLATNDVGTPLNRSASSPDYRLQVYIEKFERDVDNQVKLSARWQLSIGGENEPVGVFSTDLVDNTALASTDYDAMVASMRGLYGQLCQQIAETIVAQER